MACILYKDGVKHLVSADQVEFLLSEGYTSDNKPVKKRKAKKDDKSGTDK